MFWVFTMPTIGEKWVKHSTGKVVEILEVQATGELTWLATVKDLENSQEFLITSEGGWLQYAN